jgi:hypothetical protein
MHAVRVVCLGGVVSVLACGDDGGRASASAGQTDGASASVPMTSTVPTGSVSDTQGGFDFSYLWVANTDQGSISKVNTETLIEEARYYSDLTSPATPALAHLRQHHRPLRRRVQPQHRLGHQGRRQQDPIASTSNGNGMIDTSPNKDTLLPWGTDECMLWSTQVTANIFSGGAGPRGTTWTPGDFNKETCQFDNQKVWVGWLTAPGQAVMGRLDGETGVLETRPSPCPTGRSTTHPTATPPTAPPSTPPATSGPPPSSPTPPGASTPSPSRSSNSPAATATPTTA